MLTCLIEAITAISALGLLPGERQDSTSISGILPEIEISADRRDLEPVQPQLLQGDELRRLNSHNVADALRYFSGVQIKDYGGIGGVKTIDIRSMGSSHMGVFYDGLPIGNAQNGQIDLGRYSLDNIEEIALYNGQKSTVFQPARDFASSGTLYIRTRRPHFKPGRKLAASATFRTGSFGLINPQARIDWRISSRLAATANAEYTHATGRYRFRYKRSYPSGATAWDTTATRHNGQLHALRLEAGLFGSLNNGDWLAKAYYYDSSRGIPGAIVNNVWKNSQHQWDRNFFLQAQADKHLGAYTRAMLNAKFSADRLRYLNPDTTLLHVDNTFHQTETYISGTVAREIIDWWEVAAAADWQYNTLTSNMARFLYPRRHQFLGSVATALNPGDLRLRASLVVNTVADATNPKGLSGSHKSLHRFMPAISAAWIPSRPLLPEVRVFWKQSFRMPTFNELYYTDIGNASLNPERADQFDAGLTWALRDRGWLDRLEIKADAYHNRVHDKIIAVPKGNSQYRWMMTNIGLVHITGLDLSSVSTWQLPADILGRLRLTYTWQRAIDKSDPEDNLDAAGTYGGQIAYIPEHSGSVAAAISWRGAELSYSWIYVGSRWDSSSNIAVNRVQPWYTSDISLSWLLKARESELRFTLEINNLLDQQYEVIRNYPMPGRNFRFTLKWFI